MGSPKEPQTKQPLGTSAWARFTSCWDLPAQGCSQSHPYPPLPSKLLEVKAQTGPGRWEGSLRGWEVGKGLLTVFKVESVEIQAFHEVPQSLRLEGSHPGVAHLPGEEERERRGYRAAPSTAAFLGPQAEARPGLGPAGSPPPSSPALQLHQDPTEMRRILPRSPPPVKPPKVLPPSL